MASLKKEKISVRTASEVVETNEVCIGRLKCARKVSEQKFIKIRNLPYKLILGSIFLRDMGADISYSRRRLDFGNG